jgi:hypothetical protein
MTVWSMFLRLQWLELSSTRLARAGFMHSQQPDIPSVIDPPSARTIIGLA